MPFNQVRYHISNLDFLTFVVYAPNTPKSLPIRDLITGIGSHIFRFIKLGSRVTAALCIWLLMVPLAASWLRKLILAPFFTFDLQSILDTFRIRTLMIDIVLGIIETATIIVAVLAISSLKDYLESNGYLPPLNFANEDQQIQQQEVQVQEEEEVEAEQQVLEQQQREEEEVEEVDEEEEEVQQEHVNGLGNVNVNNNVDNWEIDLDELSNIVYECMYVLTFIVGLSGSLKRLFVKGLTVILWITIFLTIFIYIPRIFGSSTLTLVITLTHISHTNSF